MESNSQREVVTVKEDPPRGVGIVVAPASSNSHTVTSATWRVHVHSIKTKIIHGVVCDTTSLCMFKCVGLLRVSQKKKYFRTPLVGVKKGETLPSRDQKTKTRLFHCLPRPIRPNFFFLDFRSHGLSEIPNPWTVSFLSLFVSKGTRKSKLFSRKHTLNKSTNWMLCPQLLSAVFIKLQETRNPYGTWCSCYTASCKT